VFVQRLQEAYSEIRRQRPVAWGFLISPRLVVLPNFLTRFYGGAVTWLRWICVGRDLLASAPDNVMRYIIAHEWGHVRRGHIFGTVIIFIAAIVTTVCPRTPQWAIFGWSIGMIGLGAIVWLTRLTREFEADDEAAQQVGINGVRNGLLWLVENRPGGLTPDRRARLERVGWNTASESFAAAARK
jgi:Zn-dependent protease with chaperone function